MIPMKVVFVCFARISGCHLTVLDQLIMDSFHHALTAFEMGYAGRATSVGFGEVVLCMHCDIVRQKAPGVSIAYLKGL